MKGFFLYDHPFPQTGQTGVDRKVQNQIRVLRQAGLDCQPYFWPDAPYPGQAVLSRLPFGGGIPRWRDDERLSGVDFLYFRKPSFLSGDIRRVLALAKKRNPRLRVAMEVPTYPYDRELRERKKDLPFYMKDRYNRRRLQGLVDHVFALGNVQGDTLFGLPLTVLKNGVNLDEVSVRQPVENGVIDLCAVAMFASWHGYERLLSGLIAYYQAGGTRDIRLHFVGEGSEKALYQSMAGHPLLKGRVRFYGMLGGAALDEVYDLADIGVCSLGLYKKNSNFTGELKAREYLGKGLPMLATAPFDIGEETPPYYLRCANDASDVDFHVVARFYDGLYSAKGQARETAGAMRRLAEQTVDMRVTFRPVVDFLTAGA